MALVSVKKEKSFTRDDIICIIEGLAQSQGMYGRLLRDLREMEENDPDYYDQVMTALEAKNFTDELDFILWYET